MAILSIGELWTQRDAERTRELTRTYRRAQKVVCSTANEDPISIFTDPRIPALNSVYAGRDGSLDLRATVISQRITPDDDNPLVWVVESTYSTVPPEFPTQQLADRPQQKPPVVEWSFARYKRIIQKADRVDTDGALLERDAAVVNSAADAFDPPLEIDDSRLVLTVTRNQESFNASQALAYKDAVNDDDFLDVPPGKAKITGITGRRHIDSEFGLYWEVTITVEFRADGWDYPLLDQGFRGQPVGGGDVQVFVDKKGDVVAHAILLDGIGRELVQGEEPVYRIYRPHPRKSFADFTLLVNQDNPDDLREALRI